MMFFQLLLCKKPEQTKKMHKDQFLTFVNINDVLMTLQFCSVTCVDGDFCRGGLVFFLVNCIFRRRMKGFDVNSVRWEWVVVSNAWEACCRDSIQHWAGEMYDSFYWNYLFLITIKSKFNPFHKMTQVVVFFFEHVCWRTL